MQLAALAGAWRAAPSLARAKWGAIEPCLSGLGDGALAQILAPVLSDLGTTAGDRATRAPRGEEGDPAW
jgi:hypothetical protein